jgi:hypothetical protein
MQIKIVAPDNIGQTIMKFLASLEELVGEEKIQISFDLKDPSPAKGTGTPLGARKHYVPRGLPTDAKKRAAAIKKNIEAIGEGTMTALVYQDVINLTSQGELVTKERIRQMRGCANSSAERMLGELCGRNGLAGLIQSVEIVNTAATK